MSLDAFTLTIASALMAFASGLFVLMHWWQVREDRAALSWGAANCGMAIGVTLLAFNAALPAYIFEIVAPFILAVCSTELWVAARIFRRGEVARIPVIVAMGAWLALLAMANETGHERIAAIANLIVCALGNAAAFVEFGIIRTERIRGRWAMVCLLGVHAASLTLAAIGLQLSPGASHVPTLNWFGGLHFAALISWVGSAVLLTTMLNDRRQAKHEVAALVDPLTGLANRRAIMRFVERVFGEGAAGDVPISVLAFDLDKFKKINDAHGHPLGDQVLRIFADVLAGAAGKNDIAGRMGGEEFVMALADCDMDRAVAVAGRVRIAFQNNARFVGGQQLDATVSAGVATAPDHGTCAADVFACADAALYRAKNLGRNRVVLAPSRNGRVRSSNVSRIA